MANPFFKKYETPFESIPFNGIKLEHFEEAFAEGLKRQKELFDSRINNPEPATFDNMFGQIRDDDGYYDLLMRTVSALYALVRCDSSDELEAIMEFAMPLIRKHNNDIMLNERYWERVKAVYENHRPLDEEEEMVLMNTYETVRNGGVLLPEEAKARYREISKELDELRFQFGNNLRKERKDYSLHVTDRADMEGMPEITMEHAHALAESYGLEGWCFNLDPAMCGPFMRFCRNRELRRQMYCAQARLCSQNEKTSNVEIVKRIMNLRQEMAQIFEEKSYMDGILSSNTMAERRDRVEALVEQIIKAYKAPAIRNNEEEETFAKSIEGDDFEFKPWDHPYYSRLLKQEKYNIDSEEIRQYFPLENVIEGVFGLATTLYGITFKERSDIPVYNEEVKTYEVKDKDGSHLALLYTDFFPRKGKAHGAWATRLRDQEIDINNVNKRAHVLLVMNFTKPTPTKPALLTLREVETFLHEFGHALHSIFSNVRYSTLSCTNVYRDFVELPSMLMENFISNRTFLKSFTKHYQSGEAMPDELIDKIQASDRYRIENERMRQMELVLLDIAVHSLTEPFEGDLWDFEKNAVEKARIREDVDGALNIAQFSHIMNGGYAALYYSYTWDDIIAADAFEAFKEDGVFSQKVAEMFRKEILSKGGSRHPLNLYWNFRGHEPTIDALLKKDNIEKSL